MKSIDSIAVYCASSNKVRDTFVAAAETLGETIASSGLRLIYGDGGIGLMAAVARGVLKKKGEVVGVIPQFMVDNGWNNPQSTKTIVTKTMHERKALICEMADAMVALPGGIGTFEELLECLTWKQLGLHQCPIVILNIEGYYDKLLECIDLMVEENMMRPIHTEMFVVVDKPEDVLPAIFNMPAWDPSISRLAAI